jgi:hypothetical protein
MVALEMPGEAGLEEAFAAAARIRFAAGLRGRSVWWCAPERRPAQVRCFVGLPPAAEFAGLLSGVARSAGAP